MLEPASTSIETGNAGPFGKYVDEEEVKRIATNISKYKDILGRPTEIHFEISDSQPRGRNANSLTLNVIT